MMMMMMMIRLRVWYGGCTAVVRWSDVLSNSYTILSGVRRGGILCHVLFAMYACMWIHVS